MRILLLSLVLLLVACQKDTTTDGPETAIRTYQHHLDRNEFEAAAQISTPAGQRFLRELSFIIADEDPDSTLLTTELLAADCSIVQDTANCLCQMRDQYEAYEADFRLIRVDGRWLVDAPEDDYQMESDELLEGILDSLGIDPAELR